MLEKLRHIDFNTNEYYILGISHFKEMPSFYLLTIHNKDEDLNIVERKSFDSLELCAEELKKDYPILLYVEGENIINKVVENKIGYRKEIIFNSNPDDFYFYEFKQDNQIFSSVIRKNNLDVYIKQITDLGRFVLHASFGPFVMANLISIIKDYDEISSKQYALKFKNGKILSFVNEVNSKKDFIINEERLNQAETPLLSTFLDYKYPNENIEFDDGFLENNRTEYKFKKRFKLAGVISLITIMLLLFLSHNLQSHYQNKLAEKESLYMLSQQTAKELDELKKEKNLKEIVLQKSGINNSNFITKYIMDIGNSVSSDITLKSINIIPTLKKIRENEEINLQSDMIFLTGESENDESFNDWTIKIKELPWSKKVDIIDYNQENKSVNSFKLKIKI